MCIRDRCYTCHPDVTNIGLDIAPMPKRVSTYILVQYWPNDVCYYGRFDETRPSLGLIYDQAGRLVRSWPLRGWRGGGWRQRRTCELINLDRRLSGRALLRPLSCLTNTLIMLLALIEASVAVAIKQTNVWCIIMRFMLTCRCRTTLWSDITVSHVVLVYYTHKAVAAPGRQGSQVISRSLKSRGRSSGANASSVKKEAGSFRGRKFLKKPGHRMHFFS